MLLFALVFLSVYGGANAYLLWRVAAAFSLRGPAFWGALAFTVLMAAGPVLVHNLDRWGMEGVGRLLAWPVYVWMAVLLWGVFLFAARDLWNLLARGAGLLLPAARAALIPAVPSALAIGGLILLATLWGLHEASAIRLETVTVRTPHLPPGSPPLRIAQISDLHLGMFVRERRLSQVLALVREAKPDLFVSTGDLVDAEPQMLDGRAGMLEAVTAPLGKFAVTGNHEYYNGLEGALDFHRRAGFTVLRQTAVTLPGGLVLSGVDDPAGKSEARQLGDSRTDEDAALPFGERNFPVVLLKHRPLVESRSLGRFDLQLSGHAHKGQIWPFRYLSALANPMLDGLYRLEGGSVLYTSRGTGTWGPPLRLFAPPEVTLILLTPEG